MRLKLTGATAAVAALVTVPLAAGCSSANSAQKTSNNAPAAHALPAAATKPTTPGGALGLDDIKGTATAVTSAVQNDLGSFNLGALKSAAGPSDETTAAAAKGKAKVRSVWLKISAQSQVQNDYCVEASSRAMLSHRYRKVPSQVTLGRYMKVRQNPQHWGTNWNNVLPGLKKFTHSNVYSWYHFGSAQSYFNGMAYETDRRNTPSIGAFYFQHLPWRNMGGPLSGHAVVVTGYSYNYKSHAGSIHAWDPWARTGFHAANPFTMFNDAKWYGGNGAYSVGIFG